MLSPMRANNELNTGESQLTMVEECLSGACGTCGQVERRQVLVGWGAEMLITISVDCRCACDWGSCNGIAWVTGP